MDVVVCPNAGVTMPCATHAGDAQLPLVAHIIHRLAIGGLENGLVNLINDMPPARYRHAIVCLTDYTDFRERLHDQHVPVIALHKDEGHDVGVYVRMIYVIEPSERSRSKLYRVKIDTKEFTLLCDAPQA